MAECRMFSKKIVDSDAFIDMPPTAQLLYFHLAMRADDDGFINKLKTIMRMLDSGDDELACLEAKKFIILFESGVAVITHWRIHNHIQKDRYKETEYKYEKSLLEIDENNAYWLPVSKMDTTCIQSVSKVDTQVRLGKVRTGKDSIDKDVCAPSGTKNKKFVPPSVEEVRAYIAEKGMNIDTEKFWNYYESNGWMVGKNPMKNWRAACNTWNTKDNPKPGGGKTPSFDPAEVGRRARENDPIL